MPAVLIRFSWDLELADVDNDADLDVLVSCKRCPGSSLFRNDGTGHVHRRSRARCRNTPTTTSSRRWISTATAFSTSSPSTTARSSAENSSSRREHVFRNDGKGRFRDATEAWWPPPHNVGEDDNMVAFLDVDSDGDADFVVGSLSGPDRLLINDGKGRLTGRLDVFDGAPTPGTLGLALADLDGDGRMDVVQAQGEHPKADRRARVSRPRRRARHGAAVDHDGWRASTPAQAGASSCARVHDRKSPSWRSNGSASWSSGRRRGRREASDALVRRVPVARRLARRCARGDAVSRVRDGRAGNSACSDPCSRPGLRTGSSVCASHAAGDRANRPTISRGRASDAVAERPGVIATASARPGRLRVPAYPWVTQ